MQSLQLGEDITSMLLSVDIFITNLLFKCYKTCIIKVLKVWKTRIQTGAATKCLAEIRASYALQVTDSRRI